MTDTGGAVSPPADPRGSLTERELTVLHEMGDGLTAAQIAGIDSPSAPKR